jgi:hypothetical protein
VKSLLQSLGAAAPFGLIGFLFLGPLGGALITLLIAATDQLLTAARNLLSNVADLIPVYGGQIREWIEGHFGAEGQQTVLAKSWEELGNAVKAAVNGDSAAAGAFAKSNTDWEKLLADRNAALNKYTVEQQKLDLSQTGQKAMEQLADIQKNIAEKMAGVEALPYMQQVETFRNNIAEAKKALDHEEKRLAQHLAGGKNTNDIAKLRSQAGPLIASIGTMRAEIAAAEGAAGSLQRRLADMFAEELGEKVADVNDKLNKFSQELTGSELDHEVAQIAERYNDVLRNLDDIEDTTLRLIAAEGERYKPLLDDINAAKTEANRLEQIAVDLARQKYAIEQQIFALQQEAQRNAIGDKMADLQKEFGPVQFSNSYIEKAQEAQRRFRDEINATSTQIAEIQAQMLENNDPFREAELQRTLDLLEQYKVKLGEVSQTVTAESILVKETWTELGSILQDGIVDSLTAIITKSESLKDVMTNTFNAITRAAIEYLTKLMLIKALETATGTPGIGSFLGGFANGGVFPGGIKAFANGGIIQGPTMFGLAGEKGTEAIMPLERVGGKLGVRSVGGGGGDTHIHISAIDTQTGVEFLMKHKDTIAGGLNQQRKLNRGLDRNR